MASVRGLGFPRLPLVSAQDALRNVPLVRLPAASDGSWPLGVVPGGSLSLSRFRCTAAPISLFSLFDLALRVHQ